MKPIHCITCEMNVHVYRGERLSFVTFYYMNHLLPFDISASLTLSANISPLSYIKSVLLQDCEISKDNCFLFAREEYSRGGNYQGEGAIFLGEGILWEGGGGNLTWRGGDGFRLEPFFSCRYMY